MPQQSAAPVVAAQSSTGGSHATLVAQCSSGDGGTAAQRAANFSMLPRFAAQRTSQNNARAVLAQVKDWGGWDFQQAWALGLLVPLRGRAGLAGPGLNLIYVEALASA